VLRAVGWLGGVVFVGSLAYSVYVYSLVLAQPAASGTPALPNAAIDIVLFSVFALHHSALARSGVKQALARVLPAGAERTVYVWIASLLWLAVCGFWRPLPGVMYDITGPLQWFLHGVQIVGLALTWRGAAVIDPLELAGIRQASGQPGSDDFRVVGPFRFVRHPIYLGWLLMVFGTPLMTMSRLLFAVVSSLYLFIAIPWEERSLVETFGDRYHAYQRQVPWRILPGIW
jgi:hypothetical protein